MDTSLSNKDYAPRKVSDKNHITYTALINYVLRELKKYQLSWTHKEYLEKVLLEITYEHIIFQEICKIYKIYLDASKIFS